MIVSELHEPSSHKMGVLSKYGLSNCLTVIIYMSAKRNTNKSRMEHSHLAHSVAPCT